MADDANDLERYRRDEMTPAERHAFEKRALDDPFLRDALSGSESLTPKAFSEDVGDLNRRLVQHRAPWFTPIRIAAGVVIVAAVGWLVYRTTPVEQESIAEIKTDSTELADSTSKLLTLAAPQKDSAAELDTKEPVKSIAKTPVLKPAETQQATAQPAPSSTAGQSASGATAKTEPTKTALAKTDVPKTETTQAEAVEKETAKVEVAEDTQRSKELRAEEPAPSAMDKRASGLKAIPRKAEASPTQDFALADDVSKKSEVLVFPEVLPADSTTSSTLVILATPAGGLDAYARYLEANQRVPDAARTARIRGKVTVSFEVTTTGRLSGFRVLKSLGQGCDEELLRLVQSGPAWSPTVRNGRPQASTVWVKLEFVADR